MKFNITASVEKVINQFRRFCVEIQASRFWGLLALAILTIALWRAPAIMDAGARLWVAIQ